MAVTVAVLLLAIGTFALKAVGPLLAADRGLSPALQRLTDLLPAAMLAALVATQTFGGGIALTVDARAVGVAAAAVAVSLRAPFAVVVLTGAGVAAGLRALGWG